MGRPIDAATMRPRFRAPCQRIEVVRRERDSTHKNPFKSLESLANAWLFNPIADGLMVDNQNSVI
jgi:hypothetical protein